MSNGWLSIRNAPKDGTEILLANVYKKHQWIDEWIVDSNKDHGGYWLLCDQWDVPEEPTHFRFLSPLPDGLKAPCSKCSGSGFEGDAQITCSFCGGDGWLFADCDAPASPAALRDEAVCKCGLDKDDPIHSFSTEWQQMHKFTPRDTTTPPSTAAAKIADQLIPHPDHAFLLTKGWRDQIASIIERSLSSGS